MSSRRWRRSGFSAWASQRPRSGLLVFLTDIVLLGLALLVFALFHHVLPSREAALGIVSERGGTTVQDQGGSGTVDATPAPEDTQRASGFPYMPVPEDRLIEAPAEPDAVGYFGNVFADKFAKGEPVYTATADGFTYVRAPMPS